MTQRKPRSLPDKSAILEYVKENPQAAGKRDIARAFSLRGEEKVLLRDLLREMRRDGQLVKKNKGALGPAGLLPSVAIIEVMALDEHGEPLARPSVWREDSDPPVIRLLAPDNRPGQAAGIGERVLARLKREEDGDYTARTIRRLEQSRRRIVGLYVERDGKGRLQPTEKRLDNEFVLRKENAGKAQPGDLVLAELLTKRQNGRLGLKEVKVIERLVSMDDPKALSLIALHEQSIPTVFPEAALEQSEKARAASPEGREDLRHIPLVTIDGADARDFDDAVFACGDSDPENPGGWEILVAIADVAHYVQPGSPLDQEAGKRGNSVYFPDRVVPMLPESLSNGWCSLKPGEDRPCLAVWIKIDAAGKKLKHRFLRGIMRSAARLTYEAAQESRERAAGQEKAELGDCLQALYGAFESLLGARSTRGALDLDLPERVVVLDETGAVKEIKEKERLDSHRLIEEFMITANVAAAEELERLRRPCMYRVHESPDPQKIDALREVLETFDLRMAGGQAVKPKQINALLRQISGHQEAEIVHQMILRAQSQARYQPDNRGHFGLALQRYAHFTSPIRRYADLLVHRALIAGLSLGGGGLHEGAEGDFEELGEHISFTERRAITAERATMDRFSAAYLAQEVGKILTGKVIGVASFGLFLRLAPSGVEGLLPRSELPDDYYHLEANGRSLTGDRRGYCFSLGQELRVRVLQSDSISGAIRLALIDGNSETPSFRSSRNAKGPGTAKGRYKARGAKRGRTKKSNSSSKGKGRSL